MGEEHVVIGIEHLNGDVDVLFVSGQERITAERDSRTNGRRGRVGLSETCITGGQTRGGVEALAAFRIGGANLGDTSRTIVGGLDAEPRTDAVQGYTQVQG